jgi:hypothetical protein
MHRFMAFVIVYITLTQAVFSEDRLHSMMMKEQVDRPVTGNLRIDLFGQTALATVPNVTPPEASVGLHKSPLIAVGLSLVVPGAGQFYTEHYWEAAAFLAADVAAWVLAYHYDRKGDKQKDFFQNYANENWSVVKYATYAEATYVSQMPSHPSFQWRNSNFNNTGLRPWQRVDWNELNHMERVISENAGGRPDLGSYYSHTLPPYGDQQYYELIGKYGQFNQGWDDAPLSYRYLDPVTPHFSYYAGEHIKADKYYDTAATWVIVAVINHVVSAVHAGLSAKWYNSAHAELGLQSVPAERGLTNVPVVKMRWEF